MKTACIRTVATAMAMGLCTGLQASVTEHQPPAPLPEFKTPEQLAKWRSEQNQKTQVAASIQECGVFYTGKPYLAESGSYAFKYREFNPEMGRWTTVDPSGFPDGANNRLYAAVPSSEFDPNGLAREIIHEGQDNHSWNCEFWKRGSGNDWVNWYSGNSGVFFMYGGDTMKPSANSLATTFVGLLGLQITASDATSWTAYGGRINWIIGRDIQGNKTIYDFNYSVVSLYSQQAVLDSNGNAVAQGGQNNITPIHNSGVLKCTVFE